MGDMGFRSLCRSSKPALGDIEHGTNRDRLGLHFRLLGMGYDLHTGRPWAALARNDMVAGYGGPTEANGRASRASSTTFCVMAGSFFDCNFVESRQ